MNGKPEQTSESGNGYHDKPKLTIAQQIAHLEAKGVTFDRYSKERAAAYLSDECDFYELTSYRKLFAKRQGGKRNGEYATSTSPNWSSSLNWTRCFARSCSL